MKNEWNLYSGSKLPKNAGKFDPKLKISIPTMIVDNCLIHTPKINHTPTSTSPIPKYVVPLYTQVDGNISNWRTDGEKKLKSKN